MSVTDMEADENSEFSGETSSLSTKIVWTDERFEALLPESGLLGRRASGAMQYHEKIRDEVFPRLRVRRRIFNWIDHFITKS